jgi:hypothetical protein
MVGASIGRGDRVPGSLVIHGDGWSFVDLEYDLPGGGSDQVQHLEDGGIHDT